MNRMLRIIFSATLLTALSGQECGPGGSQCLDNLQSPPVFTACCPGYACLTAGGLLGGSGYCVDMDMAAPGECASPGQKCVDYNSNEGVTYEVRASGSFSYNRCMIVGLLLLWLSMCSRIFWR